MAPEAAFASALANNASRSGNGPFVQGPIAFETEDQKPKKLSALAHQYGPPTTTPTPLITVDHALANCTAIIAPDEIPDIPLSPIAPWSPAYPSPSDPGATS